ncbi:MAG: type II toxin-antitoxin system VapC family toxin [Spirochaetia bacterium]|jgi:predicted nucleic acid-binding protein|nr:type II toxin-antitoxin system VapC family toxin [Spirochaetia bacterium]
MKNSAAIDTNFLIDIVLDRDTSKNTLKKLEKAMSVFDTIFVPFHTLVEFIYVLENIHKREKIAQLTKNKIIDMVNAICSTPQFYIENIDTLLLALTHYEILKIGDAIIAATLSANGIATILSNDRHFSHIEGITVYS